MITEIVSYIAAAGVGFGFGWAWFQVERKALRDRLELTELHLASESARAERMVLDWEQASDELKAVKAQRARAAAAGGAATAAKRANAA